MIVWYSFVVIMVGGIILFNKVMDEPGVFYSFLIWGLIGFLGLGVFGGLGVSDLSPQEVVIEDKYVLEDFSDYYAVYEKDTYLVIQDNGKLLVRFVNKDKEMTEEPHSYYSIEYVDEEIEPFITVTLKDIKNKILKHLFWNFNSYEYKITVPVGTEIVYKR